MEPYEKIAKILRTDKDTVKTVEDFMSSFAGHDSTIERIYEENERVISQKMGLLGISQKSAKSIYDALIKKIETDDKRLNSFIHKENIGKLEGFFNLITLSNNLANVGSGYFLKEEVAQKLIRHAPPSRIMNFLEYTNADEMLKKENIFELFSALRFIEGSEWLNNVFFKQYHDLKPDDFEERPIRAILLDKKWNEPAEEFIKKKFHNVSHLKELGIIFIIPSFMGISGETMRTLTLVLHYFHEIKFYSMLFKKYASESEEEFSEKVISSLRGDVMDKRFPEDELGKKWLIVQRYLAKDDEFDWRLFYPHVNPEAIHWSKAEDDIARLGEKYGELGLSFWENLDHIGDFFPDEAGVDILVSFNLIDVTMSLVQKKHLIKYLYHHQEAIWNKIFSEFMGYERMEQMIIDNFDKGYISLINE